MASIDRAGVKHLAERLSAHGEILAGLQYVQIDVKLAAQVLRAALASGFAATPIDLPDDGPELPAASNASHQSP